MMRNNFAVCVLVYFVLSNYALGKRSDGYPTIKAIEGDTISLSCDRSVSTDLLYFVKWYKDGKEFFRNHAKRADNQIEIDPVEGFTVEKVLPSPWQIVLKDVKESASGKFTCMIVAYPQYRTIYRSTFVEVTPKTLHQQHPPDSSGKYYSRSGSSKQNLNTSFLIVIMISTVVLQLLVGS